MPAFTLSSVRKIFGATGGIADPLCRGPPQVSYTDPEKAGKNTQFMAHDIVFEVDEDGYQDRCRIEHAVDLYDADEVRNVSIRMIEHDYTHWPAPFAFWMR
jgi:hypothetical protein